MKYDEYSRPLLTENDAVELLYRDPDLDFNNLVVAESRYNRSLSDLHAGFVKVQEYQKLSVSLEEFDQTNQNNWFMPDQYRDLDIAKWVLDQCNNSAELQRVGEELLLFQERNLFPLLCYLKYLVDVMHDNMIVWGVGRGSSVASFVLYKIGIHRINSLYYDLDIREFLKE